MAVSIPMMAMATATLMPMLMLLAMMKQTTTTAVVVAAAMPLRVMVVHLMKVVHTEMSMKMPRLQATM
eukprot:9101395-Alexandrium_andersonii.AAC.1